MIRTREAVKQSLAGNLTPKLLWVALLWAIVPASCLALSSDRNKPMHIEADRAKLDEQKGVSAYWGAVQVSQGSMQLTASKITVYNQNRNITKVVAEGKPAHFKQRPDNQNQDVKADAERIEYFGEKNQVVLTGKAKVWQAGNVFQSDRIVYDTKNNVVHAGGERSEMTDKQRVHITIQPNNNRSENNTQPTKP